MKQIKQRLESLLEISAVYKLYAMQFQAKGPLRLGYKPSDLTPDYYARVQQLGLGELEHQIGRLQNFQTITRACRDLDGDFIEFGSWKGFSLLWIAYFMEREALFDRKLVGLDGFIGLPYTDGMFRKGKFANTSLKECRRNVLGSDELYPETRRQIFIEKFLYREKSAILRYLSTLTVKKLCFIHIDCDVSQSAREIFNILMANDLLADKAYFLFDDYGIEPALREEIHRFIEQHETEWTVTEHSKTTCTKNFLFERKKGGR